MNIIGIDFSILYPGVCICSDDFKSFEHLAITNTRLTKKKNQWLEDVNDQKGITILNLGERLPKEKQYHVEQRNKLENWDLVTDKIVELVSGKVTSMNNIIAIEGISYGSGGNSLIDICQATGILKSKLLNVLTDSVDKIFIFSPSELKNAIGCKGNASKTDVYLKFVEDPVIDSIKDSGLYKYIMDNQELVFHPEKNKGKGEVESPFMDMIDSTLPIIKIHEILKNNQQEDE